MKAKEMRERTVEELRSMVENLREDLFKLRFQHATGQLDDASRMSKARRDLARVLTVLNEHELDIRKVVTKEGAK